MKTKKEFKFEGFEPWDGNLTPWDRVVYCFWRVWDKIKNISNLRRNIKYTWQIWHRGWCDCDTWNLDKNIARFVYPRLVRFKEINNSFPSGENITADSWDEDLDKMIFSFKIMADEDKDLKKEEMERFEEGMNLFCKYYMELWW